MKKMKRVLVSLLAMCMLMGLMNPAAAYAASTISSVSIKAGLVDFEPGNTLPDIVIGESETSETAFVSTSSSYYEVEKAEWVTSESKIISVGDKPRMKVYLQPTDPENRKFKGGYYSSNVRITGGTYRSASVKDGNLTVILDLKPVKGQFDAPEEAYWYGSNHGRARWTMSDDASTSDYYEVWLYRGSTQIHKTQTKNTSYNFYPYMTKRGTYSFKVRVIPSDTDESAYAKKSEWTESDEDYVPEEDVSSGIGQEAGTTPSGGNTNVGWIKEGNRWYFRYPDGSYPKNSWMDWNGRWYLFDSEGWMLTGWQNRNGQYYYLDESGAMLTGWVRAGNTYYYLNPTKDQFEGVMVRNNWIVQDGHHYYLNQDGIMAEGWQQVGGNWYYFYPGSGVRAENTYVDGFRLDANGIWRK